MNYNNKYDIETNENGDTFYYKKGTRQFHREEGPACVYSDGYEAWFLNGRKHREDGPASTCRTGEKYYYLDNVQYTEEEFKEITGIDKYDIVNTKSGHTIYYKKGTDITHREGGPAVTLADGSKVWYKDGLQHREDGPSVELANGQKYWHLDGISLTEEEFNERMSIGITKAVKASETIGDINISDHLNKQVGGDHYKKQTIQPWDYMEATMPEEQFIGYLRGNVLKYVSRYDKKGGIQDIDKALHYLEKLRSCL